MTVSVVGAAVSSAVSAAPAVVPAVSTEGAQYGFADNRSLDDFKIPFGEWMDQGVDWVTVNLKPLLSVIKWPFDFLNDVIVNGILEPVPWVFVVVAFFVIGALVRNVGVGIFAAVSLTVCGLLGAEYWLQTARTIGFIGVSVILCVIIGIPMGIACGLFNPVWKVVRPILDAMQVVHSFVYMLPFIYFFGVGTVAATMVTMVFAIPPLIRLTNLGIRQVPDDVVEASRAYGAPEWRVLIDVQMPLARQAIMTGVNQTLLLAISMLGIAAIMGAGGLGRVLYRALSQQSAADAAASGLAFFLVAVVLDRISQTEAGSSDGLLRRLRLAWTHRRDPEKLLDDGESDDRVGFEAPSGVGRFAEIESGEFKGRVGAAVGGIVTIVSTFLVWHADAGFMSAYGRSVDQDLAGQSFNGLSASGGSWYGILALLLGAVVLAAALTLPGKGPRILMPDGALIAALALLVMMVSYLLASPPRLASQTFGVGAYLALAGAIAASSGSLFWVINAPCSPQHPLNPKIGWTRIIGGATAVVVILVGALSGWSFDRRTDQVVSAETRAKIEDLAMRAEDEPENAGIIATEIAALSAQVSISELAITSGTSGEGTRLGIWTLIAGLLGFAAVIPASGALRRNERWQWCWSAASGGIGAGVAAVAIGWVLVQVRSADPNYVSGVGSFLVMLGGLMLIATATGVLKEFRRSRVYQSL